MAIAIVLSWSLLPGFERPQPIAKGPSGTPAQTEVPDHRHKDQAGVAIASTETEGPARLSPRSLRQAANAYLDSEGRPSDKVAQDLINALDICDHPVLEKRTSVQSIADHLERTGELARAAAIRAAVAGFCIGPEQPVPTDRVSATIATGHREIHQLSVRYSELRSLLDTLAIPGEGTRQEREQAIELAELAMREAPDYYAFVGVAMDLDGANLLVPLLRRHGLGIAVGDRALGASIVLAGCAIFGGCEAGGVIAVQACIARCDRPMSVQEMTLTNLSEPERLRAQTAVVAFFRLRGQKG